MRKPEAKVELLSFIGYLDSIIADQLAFLNSLTEFVFIETYNKTVFFL